MAADCLCAPETLVVAFVGLSIAISLLWPKSSKRIDPTLPLGVVRLHMLSRGPFAPNISPFPLKLETFLRANKIPYEVDFRHPKSSKGKSPWIQINGEAIADSQFCIEILNEVFGVDMDAHLNAEEKAVSHAFRKLLEESMYFLHGCSRFLRSSDEVAKHWKGAPKFVIRYVIPFFVNITTYFQGIGRHSVQEQWSIFVKDIIAINVYLGNKTYFMGDKMSEIDCSMFGILGQFVYQDFEKKHSAYIEKKCPNVKAYLDRIKKEIWSDWPCQE